MPGGSPNSTWTDRGSLSLRQLANKWILPKEAAPSNCECEGDGLGGLVCGAVSEAMEEKLSSTWFALRNPALRRSSGGGSNRIS
jgi:hypothetical protein